MAHVFLSYSRTDRSIAVQVIHALESYGLTVWWDWKIDGGEGWRGVIKQRLDTCGAVVVLWTPNSVKSDMVIEEAAIGARRGNLIPLVMELCEPPSGFREINHIPLWDWSGERHAPEFQRAVASVQRRLEGFAPLLMMDERTEIMEERRRRAFRHYELTLRGQIVHVLVGDQRDDQAVSKARTGSDLETHNNAEYLNTVIRMHFADKSLDELLTDQTQPTPLSPVSTLAELAQAITDRAVRSYRDQFDIS